MIELNIDLPKGYKATGELRQVQQYEYYYDEVFQNVHIWDSKGNSVHSYVIVEKCAKQKEGLIDCLCGVSDDSLEQAKERAENFNIIRVIDYYDNSIDMYEDVSDVKWAYAYPVSLDDLKNLTHNLEK